MKLQGTQLNIAYSTDNGTTWAWMGYARNASVKKATENIKVSSPDTGTWEDSIPGRCSWSMQCSCLLTDDLSILEGLFANRTKFKVRFGRIDHSVTTGASFTGKKETGTAYIASLEKTGNMREMAQLSISLQGCGALTYE